MTARTAALLLAAALLACARAPAREAARPDGAEAVAAEALDADRAMAAATAARDAEAFIAHVSEEAIFLGSGVSAGRAAVGVSWARFHAPEGPRLEWTPATALGAPSGDLAMTRGPWRFFPAGAAEPAATGEYLTVWRRDPDGLLRVAIDGPATPLPALPAGVTRRRLREVASADGALRAEVGLLLDGEREAGRYVTVWRRAGEAVETLADVGALGK
jgi:ketosteroid isomerase-like protein